MAKISQYTSGGAPQNGDQFIVARAGANYTITWLAMYNAIGAPPATTAANDFQVGNGSGAWIKKTLAETKTILGLLALAFLNTVGTSQIDNDAVTYAKMQNVSATNKLLGRSTAGAGDVEEIGLAADHAFSAGSLQLGAFTGDITKSAGSLATSIGANKVTYAMMQQVSATDKVLGRSTAGAGNVEEIACTAAGRALIDDADAATQRTTLGLVIGTNVQAYDADLTTWAGVTPGTGVATALAVALNAAGGFATIDGTATLTNKRVNPRVTSIASSATPTINTDNCDSVDITALAAAITSMTTNLSGTPVNFQKLTIRFKDNGSARAIAWGASFEACGVALPTTTVISKRLTVGFIYDTTTSKWGCVSSVQEA